MSSEVNRRFIEAYPFFNVPTIDDVCQLEAVAVAADGDTTAIRPSEGARALQEAVTGKHPYIKVPVAFTGSVGCFSCHINRSHFSIYFAVRR